jgi:alpha-1,3-rhamnosyl/mannosyltransferase
MRIVVDAKNMALYGGGISQWTATVLPGWVAANPGHEVLLLLPRGAELRDFSIEAAKVVPVTWPSWLPRPLRHPAYDNVIFPRAVSDLHPDLVFSPYHDVRMPRGIPSVVTVHDLCYLDAAECYPRRVRSYYLAMLRVNVARATHVLTVSEATRERLHEVLGVPRRKVSVVPNALSPEFAEKLPPDEEIVRWRARHGGSDGAEKLLLYPGGVEYRKNVGKLMEVLHSLWEGGERISLLVTGELHARWEGIFPGHLRREGRVSLLGRLSTSELRLAFASADAVVYPSLCEGFGRVCLEAQATGTPLACSDLPVLREVAGDHAFYFDPGDGASMAGAIRAASAAGRRSPRFNDRFGRDAVQRSFAAAMAPFLTPAPVRIR